MDFALPPKLQPPPSNVPNKGSIPLADWKTSTLLQDPGGSSDHMAPGSGPLVPGRTGYIPPIRTAEPPASASGDTPGRFSIRLRHLDEVLASDGELFSGDEGNEGRAKSTRTSREGGGTGGRGGGEGQGTVVQEWEGQAR